MHKGTRHVGKAPEALRAGPRQSDRLKLLQKKLAKAVKIRKFRTGRQPAR
jgi:protein-arginine kinase activator protein McsA